MRRGSYVMPNGSKLYWWGNEKIVQVSCDKCYLQALLEEIRKMVCEK